MLLGCIADDFTGASDLANTLARGGMHTKLFIGIPADVADCDALVVALKTRSVPAGIAITQSLEALRWLQQQGCQQILFKYCSTFDSTPDGNIGPVAEALLDALGARFAIVCPAFPATGRLVFQGHLFVNGRLLNESGLQNHPLNPMTDPDLVRWLGLQSRGPVGLVALDIVRLGTGALRQAMDAAANAGKRLIVVDAIDENDLWTLGAAVSDCAIVTGGSGIGLGLADNFSKRGLLDRKPPQFTGVSGPGLVLSGSCSATSRTQVARYRSAHPALALEPAAMLGGTQSAESVLQWVCDHLENAPMVFSTDEPDAVLAAQVSFGQERVAAEIEAFFGHLAKAAVAKGVRRLVVGGGETSGAVVSALELQELQIGPEIAAGVPALAAGNDLRLALKSGNFGGPDFFTDALNMLGVN